GMGTCGLVGQIGVYTGWITDINNGVKTAITTWDWTGLILISFIFPAVITYFLSLYFRKKQWIRPNDLKLDLQNIYGEKSYGEKTNNAKNGGAFYIFS